MPEQRAITFDDIAHLPRPGTNAPVNLRFSPDGKLVTYLYASDGTLTRELWAHDRETGRAWRLLEPGAGGDSDATVSREEALRRERQRQLASGVTSYAWSEQGDTLLVPQRGEIYVGRGAEGGLRKVSDGPGCIDPRLNRDGSWVAFVRDADLYALDLTTEGAAPVRLTHDASPADEHGDRVITNGLAEFVAQEEMGRLAGYWWSLDGTRLAFEQVDHAPVPLYYIQHPGADSIDIEVHRYPFAGAANVRVRLGVVRRDGGAVTWLPLGDNPDIYLARVHWTPDGKVLAQVESRDQLRLDVRRIDPDTGESTTLWTEQSEIWVNLHDDLRFVRAEDAAPEEYTILWSSERTGKRELYLYTRDGELLRQVSVGDICIDNVTAGDVAGGMVYVEGWARSPVERHLFRIPLAGGAAERLTEDPGTHRAALSPHFDAYIDLYDSMAAPPRAYLRSLTGGDDVRLHSEQTPDPAIAELGLTPPRFVSVTTEDGETLHGAVYPPHGVAEGQRVPVLVVVYGGPHAQTVADTWAETCDLRAQYYAQQGFLVLKVDNRGSARRGLTFEGALRWNMGDIEVRDQVEAVKAVAAMYPEADLSRVGVYGWSYGGYMALMCLARAPEVFHAAVAGAPVTSWDGYDTHYTERYMGTPATNPDGYKASSVMTHAQHIRGSLLLVHGMIDENVHFRHTGRLITALVTAGIEHETMLFPEERHSPRRERDRAYMERRIAAFLQRALSPRS